MVYHLGSEVTKSVADYINRVCMTKPEVHFNRKNTQKIEKAINANESTALQEEDQSMLSFLRIKA